MRHMLDDIAGGDDSVCVCLCVCMCVCDRHHDKHMTHIAGSKIRNRMDRTLVSAHELQKRPHSSSY
jgi:hypothetical protein